MNAQPSQLALRLAALRASKHIACHELALRNVPTAAPLTAAELIEIDCIKDLQQGYSREANNKLIIALYVTCCIMHKMPFFTFRDSYYQHWHKDICGNSTVEFIEATQYDYDIQRANPVLYRMLERCTAWELAWLANDMNISYKRALGITYSLMIRNYNYD